MDFQHQAGGGQHLDVAAHRHVGHAQGMDQIGDSYAAGAVNLPDDCLLSLSCQHAVSLHLSRMTARSPAAGVVSRVQPLPVTRSVPSVVLA